MSNTDTHVAIILEGAVGSWTKAWVIYPGAEASPGGPPEDNYLKATVLPESEVLAFVRDHDVGEVERVGADSDG